MNAAGSPWHWGKPENPLVFLGAALFWQPPELPSACKTFQNSSDAGEGRGDSDRTGELWSKYFPDFKLLLVCVGMAKHAAGPCVMYKRLIMNMLWVHDVL